MLACGACLTSCVTVDVPGDPAAGATGADYSAAMTYLVKARALLLTKAQRRENLNDFTKGGVGVSVLGAGIATVFHSAATSVAAVLTYGATNYAVNQDINPLALDAVYRAGISNMDCIRASAVTAKSEYDGLAGELPTEKTNLDHAIIALEADVAQAGGDPGLAAPVDQAVKDINAARAVSRHITAYLATTNLGEQIVSGVNGTLRVVNEQAQTRSPSRNLRRFASAFPRA